MAAIIICSDFGSMQQNRGKQQNGKDLYIENYKNWWKKSKMTQIDGEIHHVNRLEESI